MKKDFCVHGHDIRIVGRTSHGMCRECHRIHNRDYMRERARGRGVEPRKLKTHCAKGHELKVYGRHRRRCAECHREDSRRRSKLFPEKAWAANIKRWYGITVEEYTTLISSQAGRCAICKAEPAQNLRGGKAIRMAVDHDHSTGAVRGILCWNCNSALGILEDHMAEVQAYLKKKTKIKKTYKAGKRVVETAARRIETR